jgi:hypothetical protein
MGNTTSLVLPYDVEAFCAKHDSPIHADNCSSFLQSDGTVEIGQITKGEFQANPDIAGRGVGTAVLCGTRTS